MGNALSDRVAVVTGGSSGIGLAIAKRFAGEGARVFVTGRRAAELDEAVGLIGSSAVGVRCDSSELDDLDELYRTVEERAGHIDVLVANAGGGTPGALGAVSEADFDAMLASNVKGVFFTVQKALPLLVEGARIILTGSTAGSKAMPGASVYGASKATVRSFARSWMVELADRSIRVNVVAPGPVVTPGLVGSVPAGMQDAFFERMRGGVPIGRLGRPDEIAEVALFLASDASSFVNGAEVFADGGQAQV
jgi:NAD(P)-dependent dehydrogenase (short-subunit alcohol dehydrogenase family)